MIELLTEMSMNLILNLQSIGEWFTSIMKVFTFLGNEEFYILIFPILYWSIDSTLGLRIGFLLMVGNLINSVIKVSFLKPRPFWVNSEVKAFADETSFGFPSNHAQSAIIVWGYISHYFNKRWIWIVGTLIIFFIGISRLALGVHYPSQALIGWIIGAIILELYLRFGNSITSFFSNKTTLIAVLIVLIISTGFIASEALIASNLSGWDLPTEWINNYSRAYPDSDPLNPFSLNGVITSASALFGLACGVFILRGSFTFTSKGNLMKRMIRYPIGLLGLLLLWYGLGNIFPRGETMIPYILRFIRYGLIGFWITGGAPIVFKLLNLTETEE